MVSSTDFGQLVTFSPGDSYPNRNDATRKINVIFDNGFFEVLGDDGVDSSSPFCVGVSSDLADAARNSMVEIGNDIYKVVTVQPDGTGITTLILEGPR